MTSSGGLVRSRPATRSMVGTITRITIGPIHTHTGHPVSWCIANATIASDGTTSPISQSFRLPSCHSSVDPSGTVALLAIVRSSHLTSGSQMSKEWTGT